MTRRNMAFFNIAREISHLSCYKRARLGAVIVDGKRVLSTGYNTHKTNPTQARYNVLRYEANTPPKVHAEIAALNPLIGKRDIDFSRVRVFIYRELKDGTRAMARPCPSCLACMRDLGIKHIAYTTPDGFAEEEI